MIAHLSSLLVWDDLAIKGFVGSEFVAPDFSPASCFRQLEIEKPT
jgi:hypothetical protein